MVSTRCDSDTIEKDAEPLGQNPCSTTGSKFPLASPIRTLTFAIPVVTAMSTTPSELKSVAVTASGFMATFKLSAV